MTAGKSFSLQIAEFVAKTKLAMDLTVQKTVQELDEEIVKNWPVGDPLRWKSQPKAKKDGSMPVWKSRAGYVGGRSRANWQLSIGAPASGVLNAIDTSPGGSDTIAAHKDAIAQIKAGDIIYLTNNIVYAVPIEYGHSGQAPAGVVGLAILQFPQFVQRAAEASKK